MDAYNESARECNGASIPPQHHPEVLPDPRLGGACTNSIRHKKRYDIRGQTRVNPWNPALEYHFWQHRERGCLTRGKYYLQHQWYPGGHSRGQYFNARVEGKHHPWVYDLLNRVSWTEPSNHKDRSGAVYTPSLLQPSLRLLNGGGDKAMYSQEILRVAVRWKADFQGGCQVDSSQNWEDCRKHKLVHVKPRGAQ